MADCLVCTTQPGERQEIFILRGLEPISWLSVTPFVATLALIVTVLGSMRQPESPIDTFGYLWRRLRTLIVATSIPCRENLLPLSRRPEAPVTTAWCPYRAVVLSWQVRTILWPGAPSRQAGTPIMRTWNPIRVKLELLSWRRGSSFVTSWSSYRDDLVSLLRQAGTKLSLATPCFSTERESTRALEHKY